MRRARYTRSVAARLLSLLLTLAPAFAQNAPPRSQPSDYPAHAQFPAFEIGAEYLVHNIPLEKGEYWARDYLVVEVILVPRGRESIDLSSNQFMLRINGKKSLLYADSPGAVAAALKYPDWQTHPNLSAAAGIGDAGVVIGAPPVVGRFPGDPTGVPPRPTPQDPNGENPYGVTPDSGRPLDQAIAIAALPEGRITKFAKGCLFFPFRGKLKSIKALDLVYDPGAGAAPSLALMK
jgi:hypothetical protein